VKAALAAASSSVALNGQQITGVADPTNPQDVATKASSQAYTDLVAQGFDPKPSVVALSTTNISSLSGLATTVDTVLLSTNNQRVALGGQTTLKDRGIYAVHSGAWTRVADMAVGSDAAGNYFAVEQGTHKGEGWVFTSPTSGTCIVGTDDLACTKFAGVQIGTTTGTARDGALAVAAEAAAVQRSGDRLAGPLSGGGNPIWQFNNAHSLANTDLSTTGLSTTVLTVTLDRTGPPADATHIVTGFAAAAHSYACVMGGRMLVFTKASTTTALVFGFLEFAVDTAIYTNASGDVTSIAFSNPRQSKSSDGAALAGAICTVQTIRLGSVLLSTAGLYGSGGSLAGATLILTVNGVGPTTLTMPTAGAAYANAAALLAGINAIWPGIATQSTGGFLLLQANAFVLGAGTANTPLGLPATNNMFKISATQPSGVNCYVTAVEVGVNNFPVAV
jgi:hypothetical protein